MTEKEKYVTFYKNPKIDYLFMLCGGKPVPPKHDQFKPIEALEIDEDGNEKIIKDFYVKKPGKNAVIEFQNLIKETASEIFNDENKIKSPNEIEVVISISTLEKQFKIVDVDNLAKTILDGLEGVAFDNDAQVSNLIINKHIHPMKINAVFVGITKLTEKRRGFREGIKLFGEKEWE